MNKTEIQARIEKCESDLASLKADLAKCDCTDGIEQEKCWQALNQKGEVITTEWRNKNDVATYVDEKFGERFAYLPECRQVTADDVCGVWKGFDGTMSHDEFAKRAHKLGFRMKVTP